MGGGGEDFVFLSVVEVLDGEARLLFAEGCGGEGALAVGFEGSEIVLETGNEGDVLDRACGCDGCEQVPHHGGVDADVFGFGGLAEPGGEKDVSDFFALKGLLKAGRIEEVSGYGFEPGNVGVWLAREAQDLPALSDEVGGEVVADDSGDAGDECGGHWRLLRSRCTERGTGSGGSPYPLSSLYRAAE